MLVRLHITPFFCEHLLSALQQAIKSGVILQHNIEPAPQNVQIAFESVVALLLLLDSSENGLASRYQLQGDQQLLRFGQLLRPLDRTEEPCLIPQAGGKQVRDGGDGERMLGRIPRQDFLEFFFEILQQTHLFELVCAAVIAKLRTAEIVEVITHPKFFEQPQLQQLVHAVSELLAGLLLLECRQVEVTVNRVIHRKSDVTGSENMKHEVSALKDFY